MSLLTSLQAPFIFGLVAACVTSLGILAIALKAEWSARNAGLFGLAAGGMLLTLSLLHIAPQAFARSENGQMFILAGFLAGLLLSHGTRLVVPGHGAPGAVGADRVMLPILAIGAHSFIDGAIYAVTFAASFETGVLAVLGLIIHEFPEGIIAFAILQAGGVGRRAAALGAFMTAALTTPLGVLVSAPLVYLTGPNLIGDLFAVSAGLLLFVATGPLLAPAREETPTRSLSAIGAGVAVAAALALAPIHAGHDHGAPGLHDHHHDHPAFARPVMPSLQRP
ncbi:MAG: ZIP family metal transporter [Pseudomonadota bacterium]